MNKVLNLSMLFSIVLIFTLPFAVHNFNRTSGELNARTININPEEAKTSDHSELKLRKRLFESWLFSFYIGKSDASMFSVPDGVYVTGIKGHSGLQGFTIYSLDRSSQTDHLRVKLNKNVLEIHVEQDKSKLDSEQHLVYQTQTSNFPEIYEVYRNGKKEKSSQIPYGVE